MKMYFLKNKGGKNKRKYLNSKKIKLNLIE